MVASGNPPEPLFIRVGINGEMQHGFVHVLYFAHLVAAYIYNSTSLLPQLKLDNVKLGQVRYGTLLSESYSQAGGLCFQLIVVLLLSSDSFQSVFPIPGLSIAIETYGNKRNTACVVAPGRTLPEPAEALKMIRNSVIGAIARFAELVPTLLPNMTPTVFIGLGVTAMAKTRSGTPQYCRFLQKAPFMKDVSHGKTFFTAARKQTTKVNGQNYVSEKGYQKAVHLRCANSFTTFGGFGLPISFHGALAKDTNGRDQTYCVWARKIQHDNLQLGITMAKSGGYVAKIIALNESITSYNRVHNDACAILGEMSNGGRYEHTSILRYGEAPWQLSNWVHTAIQRMTDRISNGKISLHVYNSPVLLKLINRFIGAHLYRLSEIEEMLHEATGAEDIVELLWQQTKVCEMINSFSNGRGDKKVYMPVARYLAGRSILPPLSPSAQAKRHHVMNYGGDLWYAYLNREIGLSTMFPIPGLLRTRTPLELTSHNGGFVCLCCHTTTKNNTTNNCSSCEARHTNIVPCKSHLYRECLRSLFNRTMSELQKTLINSIMTQSNLNVFLMGPGGGGKSHVARYIAKQYVSDYGADAVLIVGPTKVVAENMSGTTFHSLFGLKKEDTLETQSEAFLDRCTPKLMQKIAIAKLLIVDESALLPRGFLQYINDVAQRARGSASTRRMFGGLRLILLGDLLQLGSIETHTVNRVPAFLGEYAFQQGNFAIGYLDESHRFDLDEEHVMKLKQLRRGANNQDLLNHFNKECGKNGPPAIRRFLLQVSIARELNKRREAAQGAVWQRNNILETYLFNSLYNRDLVELLREWFGLEQVSESISKEDLLNTRVICKETLEAEHYSTAIVLKLKELGG